MIVRFIDEQRPVTPGERVDLDLVVTNDSGRALDELRIQAVGAGSMVAEHAVFLDSIPDGATVRSTLQVTVPKGQPPGRHRIGVEVTDQTGATATATTTLVVSSAQSVTLSVIPSTVRGLRGGRFTAEVANLASTPVSLELGIESDHLTIELPSGPIELAAGERVGLPGRVRRSDRDGTGDEHLFTVVAAGHFAPLRETAVFSRRRPLRRVGRAAAVVATIGIWLVALTVGLRWMDERIINDLRADAGLEIAAGDDAPNTDGQDGALDPAMANDGSPETSDGGSGNESGDDPGAAADADPPDGLAFAEATTKIGGIVTLEPPTEAAGVTVTLRPISLANRTEGSAADEIVLDETTSNEVSTETDTDGSWLLRDIAAPGRYQVVFEKTGYLPESRFLEFSSVAEPQEVELSLIAADGRIAGFVTDEAGPAGGATVSISGGTVDHTTTTATDGQVGTWSIDGLETPASYLITIERPGYRAETQLVDLAAGESAELVTTRLSPATASIEGLIRHGDTPIGGVMVEAVGGDVTRITMSLTDGEAGRFVLPHLPAPGSYTLTASGDGYITRTLAVDLGDDDADITVDVESSRAELRGTVTDGDGSPLSGVAVHASDGDRFHRTTTAAEPAGSYDLAGLPAGEYVVRFEADGYEPMVVLVTLDPGETSTIAPTMTAD